LYYCVGAYAVGLAGDILGISDMLLLLLVAAVISLVLGATLGLLLSRYRQIFFAMLSLAFSMILFGVLVKTEALGSTDGFNIVQPSLLGWTPDPENSGLLIYGVSVVLMLIVAVMVQRYFASPMGFVGEAVRENEIRVEYLGSSPRRAIYAMYVVAAVLAGLGGAINAFATGHIDPELAYWTTSGEFVFIALMGGVGHVAAPLTASVLFELIRTYAFQIAPHTWQMILGGTLLLIIIFVPKGLWSLVGRWRRTGAQ
jgi:branched-chain amino acid transport system permease protein